MIKLVPSRNPDVILSFIKGKALMDKCAGGMEVDSNPDTLRNYIKSGKSTFLVAVEAEKGKPDKGLGFVVLHSEGGTAMSIHLCLRTIGEKTKRIFALAINYIKYVAGCSVVHAVFPEEYRACQRLAKFFGFKDDPTLKPYYAIKSTLPYVYKRLDLA